MDPKSKIVQNAALLALKYHAGQYRLYGLPFVIHPVMVATILAQNGFNEETIAAGFLHDVLEDTNCSEKEIRKECGDKVLKIVKTVSKNPRIKEKEQWEQQKDLYIEAVRRGSIGAKAVCLADKIHNAQSLLEEYKKHGPSIFSKFVRGKDIKVASEKKVLAMLKESWNHPLLTVYEELIKQEDKLTG